MPQTCSQCGSSMPDAATFCSQCGGTMAAPAPAPATSPHRGLPTMIGGTAVALPPPPQAAAPARPAGTMMGIAAVDLLPPQSRAAAPSSQPAQQAAFPTSQENRTMLGVAMPGIAPIHPGQAAPPSQSDNRTMLGVAVPGIAPLHAGASAVPSAPRSGRQLEAPVIVPRPKTFFNEPMPEAFRKATRQGIPLALVAGGVGALVLLLGLAVVLMWKSAPPLVVQPRLGEKNNEQLHLVCESCPDGTTASLGAAAPANAKATFKTKECNLDLTTPLRVGDNPIEIHLDRPGIGRDEIVKAVVPIAYRVRADLSDISAEPPAITVRVETLPGSEVRIDGKPVALDASGKGAQAIDITAETEGSTEESRVIEKTVPYEVTLRGQKTERGTVSARVGVVALQIDAPSSHPIFDTAKFFVAGRTVKGSKVTVNGRPIDLTPAGTFGEPFETPGVGDTILTIRATPPQLAARTTHLTVRRVEHLETEARAFEGVHLLGYDAVSSNIAANVGQSLVVEGEVLESRTLNHQTILVVNDHRGCAHLPCPARVTHGADDGLRPGDAVRAYGHVTRAVKNADGKSLPEVEADFLLVGKRKP